MSTLSGRTVLVIIGGGVAAYKALELVRELKRRGAGVNAILTAAGAQFVTPLAVSALAGSPVHRELFDLDQEARMGHIEFSRAADLVVVAPATANLMAKMASGLADDLATTTLLATDKPVLIAPAMNVRMWLHEATQGNLATLKGRGIAVIGPDDGDMACGEYGPGRLAEPRAIADAVEAALAPAGDLPLKGRKVLITAGPTHEPIDPVRYIANRSSGRQGYALAEAARDLGARTILVSGPVSLAVPPGIEVLPVETAAEMLQAVSAELPADIAIFAAAVADWRVAGSHGHKLKKDATGTPPELRLAANPDILKTVGHLKEGRPGLVVGFAAETDDVIGHATAKLAAKGADLMVANDVSAATGIMGGMRNRVHLVTADGVEDWPDLDKREVAARLMRHLAALIAQETAP
jgi:phosphopantothenoylcysteine decarboxylase/phosphopantothenate--cysteine ligase